MRLRISPLYSVKSNEETVSFNLGLGELTPDHQVFLRGMRVNAKGQLLAPGVKVGRGYINQVLFSDNLAVDLYSALRADSNLAARLSGDPYEMSSICHFGPKDNDKFFGRDNNIQRLREQLAEKDAEIVRLRELVEASTPPWEDSKL